MLYGKIKYYRDITLVILYITGEIIVMIIVQKYVGYQIVLFLEIDSTRAK